MSPDTIVFFENRLTALSEARVGILTHALNFGTGVFEGIRGYWNEQENQVFLMRPLRSTVGPSGKSRWLRVPFTVRRLSRLIRGL